MLDSCPKYYSCGTIGPIWTDDRIPTAVGVVQRVTAYQVNGRARNCRWFRRRIAVMRCSDSTEYDYIYKYVGDYPDTCAVGFCGMN